MRRLLIVGLAGSVISITAAGVQAASPRGRVVTETYAPNPYHKISLDYGGDPGVSIATVELEARAGEGVVSVSLTDDSGYPVKGAVSQVDALGRSRRIAAFCGETPAPVPIDAAKPVIVNAYSGTCSGELGAATEGTVTATFFGKRAR